MDVPRMLVIKLSLSGQFEKLIFVPPKIFFFLSQSALRFLPSPQMLSFSLDCLLHLSRCDLRGGL